MDSSYLFLPELLLVASIMAIPALHIATENRRYIQEVVIPSYEISDSWDNPHYNNWLKSGGWKD